jgi:hypothetical protein
MVPFIGTEAANAANWWFFGLRTIEVQASASGTSTASALQVDVAIGTAAGSGSGTAVPTRVLETAASTAGTSSLNGEAIRWNQEARGEAAGSDQASAHGQGRFLTSGTIQNQAVTSASCTRECRAIAAAEGSASVFLGPFWIVATPVYYWLLPSHAPNVQRHAMVTFTGTEAANVATNWFFGTQILEARASASGTSSATAFQFTLGECAAAGTGTATAAATRILRASVVAAGASTISGTAIRWSHVVAGTAATWGQAFATAIRQLLTKGTIAGRVGAIHTLSIRQRNAIAAASSTSTTLCNPWIVALGGITGAGTAAGTATRLRNATTTGAGHTSISTTTGIRVALLTAETLDGTSTAQVDIWIYADGTALAEAVALAAPTGTWQASATGLGITTLDAVATRLRTGLAVAAGASTAGLDPTIHIEGAAAGEASATGAGIPMAPGTATSAGHATLIVVGRRIQYGRAPASGAVMIGATGSWVRTVYGYAEGQGEAVAGIPDWRQTGSAIGGCGSVLSTTEELAGLIVSAGAEAAGSCPYALAIPDANILVVEAAEPALADDQGDTTAAPDLIVWLEPLVCEQHSQTEAVPETVLDAQIAMAETPGLLAANSQYAIAMAEASSSGWSLALAAANPIERLAGARAGGGAVAEYQEPICVMEPVSIEGFANVVAVAWSSERMEGRAWAWGGADAVIAACWQDAEAAVHCDSVVRGLGGYPLEANSRRTRGNSVVWARAKKGAAW